MVFSTSKVIDWDLGTAILGSRESAEEMMVALVGELPQYQQELAAARQADDYQLLEHLAHNLHGGACYCGTVALKNAARQLERLLLGKVAMERIHVAYDVLCNAMQAVSNEFAAYQMDHG